jgi:putative aminopeptidase FrvX
VRALISGILIAAAAVMLAADTVRLEYSTVPREVIQRRVALATRKPAERYSRLRALFEEAGCAGAALTEQPVKKKHAPNLICALSGATESTIVVSAHFDAVPQGDGAVDDWSGASLLPSLYQGLAAKPRHHRYLFIGFTDEELGLVGSRFYAKRLTPEELGQIRAMVNVDSVGMGEPKIWVKRSDKFLVSTIAQLASQMKIPLGAVNVDGVGDDDTHPFADLKIPVLSVHSVTRENLRVLHSRADTVAAIHLDEYYSTYRLILSHLAYLDEKLE